MITAHAGSDGYTPNSISFILAMLDAKVDCLEIDCNLTEDGIVYLNHNPVLDMRGLLTLDLALELIAYHPNKDTLINIDCKNILIGRVALERAANYDLEERIILSGKINYGDFPLEERKQLFYSIENEMKIEREFSVEEFKESLNRWYENGIRYVESNYEYINPDILEWIHNANLELSVWTVDDFERIDKYLAHNIYNITTNRAIEYMNK